MNNKKLRKALKKTMQTEMILRELLEETQIKDEYPTSTDVSGAYAVIWDYEKKGTKISRAGLAESFEDPHPARSLDETGSSPFDDIMPWAGMKKITLIDSDRETEDEMVIIPEFWYTAVKDEGNHRWIWAVSPTAKEGYCKHPGSGRFVGRYHTSLEDNTALSVKGNLPLTRTSWNKFKEISSGKGAGWGMMDIATWSAIQLLYLVEFADFNSKETLGRGYKNMDPGEMGGTDKAIYHTLKASGTSNQYRNIEDPFSNVFDWIDGFKGDRGACKITIGKNKKKTGFGLAPDGWIANFGYSPTSPWAFIPSESTDDKTERLPEYTWSWPKEYGKRPAYVGGDYSSYRSYGLFYFNANNNASNTNADLGSRLQKT